MPDLGKYGVEVLSAYGVSLLLLGGIIWLSWHRGQRARNQLRELEEDA